MTHYVIIGAGGHGQVVADALLQAGMSCLGYTDPDQSLHGTVIAGLPVLGGDRVLADVDREETLLANGLGLLTAGGISPRQGVQTKLEAEGWTFPSIIHPSAIISARATVEAGAQVLAGAVVQTGAHIGRGVIINTRAVVEHHSHIAAWSHIAPGAIVCGGVRVGAQTLVGAGATVIQGVHIGVGCLIGAGAVVVGDIEDGHRAAGVPAREFGSRT